MAEQSRRRMPSSKLRAKVLEKFGEKCTFCGVKNDDAPLEIAHLTPISAGGSSSEDNLILLCPICSRKFYGHSREIEFVDFLMRTLREHPDYREIVSEAIVGNDSRVRADIIADRKFQRGFEPVLIECKTPHLIGHGAMGRVYEQLERYRKLAPERKLILAIPGKLPEKTLSELYDRSVEVWDSGYLAETFFDQIRTAPPSFYRSYLLSILAQGDAGSPERDFISKLQNIQPGQEDWYLYQSLVGDILEYLFTPPLSKPIPEHKDKTGANRRDFIIPNYATDGFWSFARTKYLADYVVVDAKNLKKKVSKKDVLQVANYLKPHGAGLFGMIFSRSGGDSRGCDQTLREQWAIQKKLIIVLSDRDVEEMLTLRDSGEEPDSVLGRAIQEFRLSL